MIQSFEICYTFWVWIFSGPCELILWECHLVHCSVVVCNYVSLFFLYLKECVIILNFWIHSVVWLDKKEKAYKAQTHCCYAHDNWSAWNVSPLTITLSPNGPLEVKTKCCMGEQLFVYYKSSWIACQRLVHWNWDIKLFNLLCGYVNILPP